MKLRMAVNPDPQMKSKDAYTFVFKGWEILVIEEDEGRRIPKGSELERTGLTGGSKLYLGVLDAIPCYSADLDPGIDVPDGFSFIGLRDLFGSVSEDLFLAAGHAFQIVYWNRTHQYCGKCGASAEYASTERAKVCTQCKAVYYPQVSPAVIVAVKKGNKLLLARNKQRKHGFYSVLAGYVEPGETLEECVVREVKEETGIEVKNLKYFASQPWPFPNALMVGFTADYAGGEIRVDGREIGIAGWFTPDNLPPIPGPISIARKLIDAFLEEQKQAE